MRSKLLYPLPALATPFLVFMTILPVNTLPSVEAPKV